MKKLSAEYDRLEQVHGDTYAEFKAVREDLQRLWSIKLKIDTAARKQERTVEKRPPEIDTKRRTLTDEKI